MPITTTPSGRIGLYTRMRRFLVRFIRPESFVHTRFSAGFTITTSGFKFLVHTSPEARADHQSVARKNRYPVDAKACRAIERNGHDKVQMESRSATVLCAGYLSVCPSCISAMVPAIANAQRAIEGCLIDIARDGNPVLPASRYVG